MAHPIATPGPVVPALPNPRTAPPFDMDDYIKWLAKQGGPTPTSVSFAAGPQTQAIDASPNLPIVYGINRVRGQVIAARKNSDAVPALFWLALADGEIDNLVMVDGKWQMFVNGDWNPFDWPTIKDAYRIQIFTGSQAQAEDPNLFNFLGWHPGGLPGIAYVRVEIYPPTWLYRHSWVYALPGVGGTEGFPNPPDNLTFDFDVQGKKVYDPRLNGGTGGVAFSQNLALHWRDLRVISGVAPADINDISFQIAADNCDARTWIGHTDDGSRRFVSNLIVASKANLQSYLDQLSLAGNAHESWVEGKMCLTVEVENPADPVLTLDSTKNFSTINYTWLGQKDRPTQVRIDFRNKDAHPPYMNDFVLVPENLAAGVEPVLASYTSSVITDRAHAARAASYVYNAANGTPFRAEGDCTFEGINALPRGTKILLTTSDGVNQEMLVDVAREMSTGWHMTLRQYDDNVYADVPVSGTDPIGYVPSAPQTDTVPETVTKMTIIQSPAGIWWRPPRIYDGGWNAPLTNAYWFVDCNTPRTMCRFVTDSPACGTYPIQCSNDQNTWVSITDVSHNYIFKTDQSGIEQHVLDWDTDSIAYRYWRFAGSGGGTYWKFFAPLSEVDPDIEGYDIHDGFQAACKPPTYGNPTENDPIVAHVPATTQLSHLTPFDITPWIFSSDQLNAVVNLTVTAVRRNGFTSRGLSRGAGPCAGARFVAAQSGATQKQTGVSSDIDGTQKAAVTVSSAYNELLPSAAPAVSGVGGVRYYSSGNQLLASVNSRPYSPVVIGSDLISGKVVKTDGLIQSIYTTTFVDINSVSASFTPTANCTIWAVCTWDVNVASGGTGEIFVGTLKINGVDQDSSAILCNANGTRLTITQTYVCNLIGGTGYTLNLRGRTNNSVGSYSIYPQHTGILYGVSKM
jgi:hypothetical protein